MLHALTAAVLGLLAFAAASSIMGGAAGLGIVETLARGPWVELGAVTGLTLVTTCLAVVASSRARGGQGIGQVLRAQD